jgi:lysozyme
MYKLIDVSQWQKQMDWQKAAKLVDGAYIKSSQGTYPDPYCAANVTGVKDNDIDFGLYHYYDTRVSWKAQLDYFTGINGLYNPDFLPAIDLEMLSPAPKLADILSFIYGLNANIVNYPIIYSGPNYILNYLTYVHDLADYPLWLAHYSKHPRWPLAAPQVPLPWHPDGWAIWQYSADKNGEGKHYGASSRDIDLDICRYLPVWN